MTNRIVRWILGYNLPKEVWTDNAGNKLVDSIWKILMNRV